MLPLVLLALTAAGAVAAGGPPPTPENGGEPVPEAVRSFLAERPPADQPDRAERLYQLKRRPPDERPFDVVEAYRRARRHLEAMPRYATRSGRFLPPLAKSGPLPVPAGAAEAAALGTWEPLGPGNVGGRTRALVIDPSDPRVMYAAGVSGGVWKSTDGGRRWRPQSDLLPILSVSALAMDPSDPQVLYAGTGEGFFREVVRGTALPLRGAGILKTTDGGDRWQRLPATAGPDFYWVNDVVVSAVDPRRVYAATRAGVFRSTDGGDSWRRILDPRVNGGCTDLALRSDRPTDVLFAACGMFEQATLYRHPAAEGGGGWQVSLRDPGMARTSVTLAPSRQDVVYALAAGPGRNLGSGVHGLFRSDRGGEPGSWEVLLRADGPDPIGALLLSNAIIQNLVACGFNGPDSSFTFGWYTNLLAVDPTDPNVLFAGGVDLFRSDDGGRTWGPINFWWSDGPQNSHADMHVIAFHPHYDGSTNQTLYLGNDGGVYATDNARAFRATGPRSICDPSNSSVTWRSLNNFYGVTQFYHGVPLPPNGQRVIGGTQDNGTVLGGPGINGWRQVLGGDGGYVAVDPGDPSRLFAETQNMGIVRSVDGGSTWQAATEGIVETTGASDEADNSVLFITPFILDPNDPSRLWTGGQRLWRSDDGGASWTQASSRLSSAGKVSAIAISPVDPDRALVGLSNGFIHRSDRALTAGRTTDWPAARPRGGFVSWLAFDPRDPRLAYATYAGFGGRHLWRTRDGGASWQSLDGSGTTGIPDVPVHAVVIDPRDPQRLYLGTDLGVLVSLDGGAGWAVENTGFANAVTESLALFARPSGRLDLYAFTHGRGAWRVRTDGAAGGGGGGGGGGDACPLPPGHGRFCSECGPCDAGQGDCDNDDECRDGLTCTSDVGADFGFGPRIDVCTAPGGCPAAPGAGDFCDLCGPCDAGEGDCDRDSDCRPGLRCVQDVGADFGFGPRIDVCL
ncbi:MAG: hypothetical protein D6696_01535 [Acidobacteria bacterium]|nr:MAG: hypothetical protein D6696_01535 [Acidobacteriota bacterium]